ncbi:MAG: STAS-like domain-containing protein [Burkholderiales bacterium]|jgi:hypothetical protein|nr:STAS-like domain-containing protein [Burkholderiales bacterium]
MAETMTATPGDTEVVRVADFTYAPFEATGSPTSGRAFRENCLAPALARSRLVTVDLDGVRGFSSAFLEAAFGGLSKEARAKVRLVTRDRSLELEIHDYLAAD